MNITLMQELLGVYVDGDIGPITVEAAKTKLPGWPVHWSDKNIVVAAAQTILNSLDFEAGPRDGLYGPQTDYALNEWKNNETPPVRLDEINVHTGSQQWPSTEGIQIYFGKPGQPMCTAGSVKLPFPMYLAWDESTSINRFTCHSKVADSARRVFENIADVYTSAEIKDFGIDQFGGCYNYRKKRGGKSLSTHSWGIAIDINPNQNKLRWNKTRASFAKPELVPFWHCWEAEGWLSLGRTYDFDWMHVQATRK